MSFHDAWWLLLLWALPGVAILRRWRSVPAMVVPSASHWHRQAPRISSGWPTACAYFGIAFMIVALARPQAMVPDENGRRRGYDFVICLDLSTSMYSEDFKRNGVLVNRLQAIKPVISAFINNRPNDRIGIVVFGGRAYTFAPLTFDHDWLRRQSSRLSIGLVEDGTAIGDALAISIARIKEGWKDKAPGHAREGSFIILLTDGSSNKGSIDPRTAATLAAEEGIPIYAVGAGTEGKVPVPVFDSAGHRAGTQMLDSEIDIQLLKDIAERTGGQFYLATDTDAVRQAFYSIDGAQKVEFGAPPPMVTRELFPAAALLGVLLLMAAGWGGHLRPSTVEAWA